MLDPLRNALGTLRSQPLRTALTLFGVVWGTGAVVFLLSWGLGVAQMVERGIGKAGRNAVFVWTGRIGENYTPASDRRHLWFTREEVRAIRQRSRRAQLVSGQSMRWAAVSHRQKVLSINISGVEPEMVAVRDLSIAAGRNFTLGDLVHRRRVALLGHKARQNLLGTERAIGNRIRVDGRSFEVVGVLGPVGTQLARYGPQELDGQVWIPLTTLFTFGRRYDNDEDVVDNIVFRIEGPEQYAAASREVRAILSERLRVSSSDEEAIAINSPLDALERLPTDRTGDVIFWITFGTLAIGGVGVLNMMLDAVQERRSEIGLRQAVGARRRDVLLQFFAETFVITALGGAVGLVLGTAATWALSRVHAPDLIPLPIMDWSIVSLALLAMIGVGLASALLPAWRATRIDPAETLRFE